MDHEIPCNLTIITGMGRAIKLHPLTHRPAYYEFHRPRVRNSFLEHFEISFNEPRYNQATFKAEEYAPNQTWFSLFADEEKEAMADEYFYGVMYRTQIKLAKERVEKILEKIETTSNTRSAAARHLISKTRRSQD